MTKLGRPPVIPDIVEEHFDELDFLWEHRGANVFTPDWDLHDLAEHEERAEAHLDGLRLAELHAVDLARERIGGGETSAATAATLVLFEAGEPEYRDLILEHLGYTGQPDAQPTDQAPTDQTVVDGVRIALRHCPLEPLQPALQEIASGADPIAAVAAADVLAFHRQDVPSATTFLDADDPWVRALGIGVAGRLALFTGEHLTRALEDPEPTVRRAALREAARCGLADLAAACRAASARDTDPDPEALAFLGVLGDPQDLPGIEAALTRPDLAPTAVAALGAMGRVQAVPTLLELMADAKLGIAATAAYHRITAAPDIEGPRPFPPPEVAEGEDEEEALPPDPEKAAADWRAREPEMAATAEEAEAEAGEIAWQSGIAIPGDRLPDDFDRLPLASRHDVYLRLRSRGPAGDSATIPDLELEALAMRQHGNGN